MKRALRIVCVSDTHNRTFGVPDGDILIHAGDMTSRGTEAEVRAFAGFLQSLPHKEKIVVAGNHDFLFERSPEAARALLGGARYLQDELAEVEGLRIWGSPWQPRFGRWAFNLDRGAPLRERWNLIPEGIDLLVTHSPPQGVLDRTAGGILAGCEELRERVRTLSPRYHVFGHIHEGYGTLQDGRTLFVNASVCDLSYRPVNQAVVLEVEPA